MKPLTTALVLNGAGWFAFSMMPTRDRMFLVASVFFFCAAFVELALTRRD